jgi:uncharacterized membrane protein YfcA
VWEALCDGALRSHPRRMEALALLLGAGVLAGAMNAAAGGGSFVSIPAMVFVGLPSVAANASSTVALLPGTLASAWAWRRDFQAPGGTSARALLFISLVGGLLGAVLLLPWLLLTGTLFFAFGRQLGAALRRRVRIGPAAVYASQVPLSVYAGYFGGGVGIMMMAVWGLLGEADVRSVSAARTLLVSAANAVATLCFAAAGPVYWPETAATLIGAVVGGYFGAVLARRVPPAWLRAFVITFGAAMTAVFFWRAWG